MRTAMEELINEVLKNSIEINFSSYLKKEKQQIIDAWNDGLHKGYTSDQGSAIQYYNETFKNETKEIYKQSITKQ